MRRDDMLELVIVIWQMIYRAKTVSIVSMVFKPMSLYLCAKIGPTSVVPPRGTSGALPGLRKNLPIRTFMLGVGRGKTICCWVQFSSVPALS